jgi:U3 small nucleolar RNA-associated protein 20
VHLPSTLAQNRAEENLGDYDSQFYEALEHWQQLNLSPAFLKFARQAGPLSASLPLLLHHWKDVLRLWIEAKDASDDEGLKAILEYVINQRYILYH